MKAVLSVLVLAALTGAATALFWRKYIHVNKQLSWNDAQAYCRKNYVDLLTIETQEEDDRYQNYLQSYCFDGCWIGLSRSAETMNFTQWSDGRSVTFTRWGDDLYNMINGNCVYVSNYWQNYDCTSTQPSICYVWKPDLVVMQVMKTWEEALKDCRMNYTDLVSYVSEKDKFAVNSKRREILTPSFWTGLRYLDGSWFWVKQPLNRKQSLMPSCPASPFRCGAQNAKSDVLENKDCEEKMNFICYNRSA